YSRFLGTAELVFKSGIENLDRIITILTNLRDIDRKALEKKITALGVNIRTNADQRTLVTLRERAKLYDDGQEEIANLLASNEEALTELDKAGIAVGKIKVSSANSGNNLDNAMADLIGLVKRTSIRNDSKSSSLTL
ncbi:MAG: hypothetical protein WCW14_02090, partial [Candidatus Paceibacterota bacterium]